jgi:putative chitinase
MDLENLRSHIPDRILDILKPPFEKYGIDTVLKTSHFLAQIAHESGDFTIKKESMNYTTPQRIVDIWPSRFNLTGENGKKNANEYIRNEEKLAEAVYGDRMGNNNPGDGFRFRGGGYLQTTGKEAYQAYADYLKKDVGETADLMRSSDIYALDAACWEYCIRMNLNPIAETGSGEDIIKRITKTVNGGYIGLDSRIAHFKKYYTLLA